MCALIGRTRRSAPTYDKGVINGWKKPHQVHGHHLSGRPPVALGHRMRSEDIIPFMERMDQMGYWAIEVWGGATFDTTHRFLGDDPWERIRTIKGILKKTPTSMLLRGQNLVGYRNYADDLTYRFVRYTAEAGVDVFRVFDALNDVRNWEVSVKALMDAKKEGLMAHFQGAMCYTLTQRRWAAPSSTWIIT